MLNDCLLSLLTALTCDKEWHGAIARPCWQVSGVLDGRAMAHLAPPFVLVAYGREDVSRGFLRSLVCRQVAHDGRELKDRLLTRQLTQALAPFACNLGCAAVGYARHVQQKPVDRGGAQDDRQVSKTRCLARLPPNHVLGHVNRVSQIHREARESTELRARQLVVVELEVTAEH